MPHYDKRPGIAHRKRIGLGGYGGYGGIPLAAWAAGNPGLTALEWMQPGYGAMMHPGLMPGGAWRDYQPQHLLPPAHRRLYGGAFGGIHPMMMSPYMRPRRPPGYGVRGYGGRRFGGYPGMALMKDRHLGTTLNIPRLGRGGVTFMDDPFDGANRALMYEDLDDDLYGWDDVDDFDDDYMSLYGGPPFY